MRAISNSRAAIGRRGFVGGLALAGSSLLLVPGGWLGAAALATAGGEPTPFPPRERCVLPRGVTLIGEAYLAEHPDEASPARLRALVPGDREALGRRVRRDFEEDDIVGVRGWLLSRTECRACALAVLTAAQPGAGA